MIIIDRKAGGGFHSISDGGVSGGQTNLDLGNKDYTTEANLCCYNRPGWYGKDKTNTFKPFLFDDDMVITSGTVAHDQLLPIPEGFREDECNWILTVAESHANLNDRNDVHIESGGFGVNVRLKLVLIIKQAPGILTTLEVGLFSQALLTMYVSLDERFNVI